MDNPRAYEPKNEFPKRKKRSFNTRVIHHFDKFLCSSDTPTASNMKGDLTKGKRLLSISGKYLEKSSFKLSKFASISETIPAFKFLSLLLFWMRAARNGSMCVFLLVLTSRDARFSRGTFSWFQSFFVNYVLVLPIGASVLKNIALSIPEFAPPGQNVPCFGFFPLVWMLTP